MCQLTNYSPSPDQLGHISCVSTAMPIWTVDLRACQIINDVYEVFHFNHLSMLHNVRARLLFSVCNHAHTSTEGAQLMFSDLLRKIHVKSNGGNDMVFDE